MKKNDVPVEDIEATTPKSDRARRQEELARKREKLQQLMARQVIVQSPAMKAVNANAKKLFGHMQPIHDRMAALAPLREQFHFAKQDIPALDVARNLRPYSDAIQKLTDPMGVMGRLRAQINIQMPADSAVSALNTRTKLFYEEHKQFFWQRV